MKRIVFLLIAVLSITVSAEMKSVENVLRHLVPQPKFYGSLVKNNKVAYDALDWVDPRPKPPWGDLVAASVEYESAKTEASTRRVIAGIADRVIDSLIAPRDRELLTAQSIRLSRKEAKGTATPEEIAKLDAMDALLTKVEAVNTRADELTVQYVAAGKDMTDADREAVKAALELVANG